MTLSSNGWFESIENPNEPLEQGDVIYSIPVPEIVTEFKDVLTIDSIKSTKDFRVAFHSGVILSQSCDISGNKPGQRISVIFAPIYTIEEYKPVNSGLVSNASLEAIRTGRMPSHHMINECDVQGFERGKSILDFKEVLTIPFDLLLKLVGDGLKRIRIRSPYREHLSAAYGRSIMRVGLPSDIEAFPIQSRSKAGFYKDFVLMTDEEKDSALEELAAFRKNHS